MIKVQLDELPIDELDRDAIGNMLISRHREEGYFGPVFCLPERLYEIHGKTCKEITRMWLKIIANNKDSQ